MTHGMIARNTIFAAAALAAASGLAWSETSQRQELASSLHKQIGACWRGTEDLGPEGQIEVVVRFRLSRDGAVLEGPHILAPEPGVTLQNDAAESVARAVTAVSRCAPYDLPKDKFKLWEELEVSFVPQPKLQLIS